MTASVRTALSLSLAVAISGCASGDSGGSATDSDAAAQVPPGATLLGSVGTKNDPEAFEIALTTQDDELRRST